MERLGHWTRLAALYPQYGTQRTDGALSDQPKRYHPEEAPAEHADSEVAPYDAKLDEWVLNLAPQLVDTRIWALPIQRDGDDEEQAQVSEQTR